MSFFNFFFFSFLTSFIFFNTNVLGNLFAIPYTEILEAQYELLNYSYPEQMLGADVSGSLSIFYGISLIISLNSCTNMNSIVTLLFFLLLE